MPGFFIGKPLTGSLTCPIDSFTHKSILFTQSLLLFLF